MILLNFLDGFYKCVFLKYLFCLSSHINKIYLSKTLLWFKYSIIFCASKNFKTGYACTKIIMKLSLPCLLNIGPIVKQQLFWIFVFGFFSSNISTIFWIRLREKICANTSNIPYGEKCWTAKCINLKNIFLNLKI